MKMRMKKGFIVLLVVAVFTSVFMMSVSAAKSVDIIGNQSAAYTDNVVGMWKYLNSTTKNFSNSTQRMRAQFEVRSGLNWLSEQRTWVNVGASAPYFETNRYNGDYYFRLALSPENQTTKGVSGKGTIYN